MDIRYFSIFQQVKSILIRNSSTLPIHLYVVEPLLDQLGSARIYIVIFVSSSSWCAHMFYVLVVHGLQHALATKKGENKIKTNIIIHASFHGGNNEKKKQQFVWCSFKNDPFRYPDKQNVYF